MNSTSDLKRIGFFSDLSYGDSFEPRLVDIVGTGPSHYDPRELHYLKTGIVIAVAPGLSRDIISPGTIIGSMSMLSDGTYLWHSDLTYYMQKYKIALPVDFLSHMAERDWTVEDRDVF